MRFNGGGGLFIEAPSREHGIRYARSSVVLCFFAYLMSSAVYTRSSVLFFFCVFDDCRYTRSSVCVFFAYLMSVAIVIAPFLFFFRA